MDNPLRRFTQKVATLTAEEERELERLTAEVTNGLRQFTKAGLALAAIRDRELYRATHESFEHFVTAKWNMTRQHAYRLMEAAEIASNLRLSPIGDNFRESHLRPLAGLPVEEQREAWAEAIEESEGTPTASQVAKAAAARKPRRKKSAAAKKLRVRVPGATIVVEPNKRFDGDHAAALLAAVEKLREPTARKAA